MKFIPRCRARIVDGQENPLSLIENSKLYEVQTYCSLTNHMWDGFWFLANKDAWDALPKDIQAVVTKHINAAALAERDDLAKLSAIAEANLVAKGLKINKVDEKPFREKLKSAGFYADWKAKFGPEAWNTLEAAVGSLG